MIWGVFIWGETEMKKGGGRERLYRKDGGKGIMINGILQTEFIEIIDLSLHLYLRIYKGCAQKS